MRRNRKTAHDEYAGGNAVSFHEFIRTRRITDTPRGDFIGDAKDDRTLPNATRWSELEFYLLQKHACLEAVRQAKKVWNEFNRWRRNGEAARVSVHVDEIELEGDRGMIPSVRVTCSQCGDSAEVYGTTGRPVTRGCIMLKQQCGSRNFYTYEEEEQHG
jgi:hypothetical protein